jgi:hypothetical protein
MQGGALSVDEVDAMSVIHRRKCRPLRQVTPRRCRLALVGAPQARRDIRLAGGFEQDERLVLTVDDPQDQSVQSFRIDAGTHDVLDAALLFPNRYESQAL